jgi:enamidase
VRVIDGTGAPARANQTVIVRDGNIVAVGDAARTPVPAGAQVMDLTGKSLIPGLVMVHEHLYYPSSGGTYGNYSQSFPILYLAGGVTSMRTGGNTNGYGELEAARAVNEGRQPGPWIDATAPYLQMAGMNIAQMHNLKDADEARRMVNFWADAGATSFKAYMHIRSGTRQQAELHFEAQALASRILLCPANYAS